MPVLQDRADNGSIVEEGINNDTEEELPDLPEEINIFAEKNQFTNSAAAHRRLLAEVLPIAVEAATSYSAMNAGWSKCGLVPFNPAKVLGMVQAGEKPVEHRGFLPNISGKEITSVEMCLEIWMFEVRKMQKQLSSKKLSLLERQELEKRIRKLEDDIEEMKRNKEMWGIRKRRNVRGEVRESGKMRVGRSEGWRGTTPMISGGGGTTPVMSGGGGSTQVMSGGTAPVMSGGGGTTQVMSEGGGTTPVMSEGGRTTPVISGAEASSTPVLHHAIPEHVSTSPRRSAYRLRQIFVGPPYKKRPVFVRAPPTVNLS